MRADAADGAAVAVDDEATTRTQAERRGEAERRLLDAAAELIGEGGPAKVTLAAVGERAGYSRGLATHHFGSKGALLRRVAETVNDRFRDALVEGGPPGTALDELLRLVGTYFDVIADLPTLHRARLVLLADAVASSSPDVAPAMVAADRSFRSSIERRVARGVAEGELPAGTNPAGLAAVLVGVLRGVTFQWMVDDTVDLAAGRREVEALLEARLG